MRRVAFQSGQKYKLETRDTGAGNEGRGDLERVWQMCPKYFKERKGRVEYIYLQDISGGKKSLFRRYIQSELVTVIRHHDKCS